MINKITFTGRETMLTKGLEKGASKVHEYVSAGKIYPKAIADNMEKESAALRLNTLLEDCFSSKAAELYSSPFAITAKTGTTLKAQAVADNYSYAVAHGKPQQVAEEASKRINFFG